MMGTSTTCHLGSKPRVRKATPISSAMLLTCAHQPEPCCLNTTSWTLKLPCGLRQLHTRRAGSCAGTSAHLLQVLLGLCHGVMQGGERRSAQLKLAPRLDGHALPAELGTNDVAALIDGGPAMARDQALQQEPDGAVVQPLFGVMIVAKLLMLRANPAPIKPDSGGMAKSASPAACRQGRPQPL